MSKQITFKQIEKAYKRRVIIYEMIGVVPFYKYIELNLKNLLKLHFKSIYLPFTLEGRPVFIEQKDNKVTRL